MRLSDHLAGAGGDRQARRRDPCVGRRRFGEGLQTFLFFASQIVSGYPAPEAAAKP
jgi:hypothetical protein